MVLIPVMYLLLGYKTLGDKIASKYLTKKKKRSISKEKTEQF